MKKLFIAFICLVAILFSVSVWAADVPLEWNTAAGATSYEIEYSTDNGVTWSTPIPVGNVTEYTVSNIPQTGLVLFKITAVSDGGQRTTREWAGAWYNYLWQPPEEVGGTAIP